MASRSSKKWFLLITAAGATIALISVIKPTSDRPREQPLAIQATRTQDSRDRHPSGSESLEAAEALERQIATDRRDGKTDDLEASLQRVIAIREKLALPKDPILWGEVDALARLCIRRESYTEAEPLAKRSSQLAEQVFGADSANLAICFVLQSQIANALGHSEAEVEYFVWNAIMILETNRELDDKLLDQWVSEATSYYLQKEDKNFYNRLEAIRSHQLARAESRKSSMHTLIWGVSLFAAQVSIDSLRVRLSLPTFRPWLPSDVFPLVWSLSAGHTGIEWRNPKLDRLRTALNTPIVIPEVLPDTLPNSQKTSGEARSDDLSGATLAAFDANLFKPIPTPSIPVAPQLGTLMTRLAVPEVLPDTLPPDPEVRKTSGEDKAPTPLPPSNPPR